LLPDDVGHAQLGRARSVDEPVSGHGLSRASARLKACRPANPALGLSAPGQLTWGRHSAFLQPCKTRFSGSLGRRPLRCLVCPLSTTRHRWPPSTPGPGTKLRILVPILTLVGARIVTFITLLGHGPPRW